METKREQIETLRRQLEDLQVADPNRAKLEKKIQALTDKISRDDSDGDTDGEDESDVSDEEDSGSPITSGAKLRNNFPTRVSRILR